MTNVEQRLVAAEEADLRLDRWFRRHFPDLGHGQLQRLLRTGQIRVDGGRVQASARLRAGQRVRVPPLPAATEDRARPKEARSSAVAEGDADWLRDKILIEDEALIVLNKPAGIAVQGGTKTARHIDGMLAALGSGW